MTENNVHDSTIKLTGGSCCCNCRYLIPDISHPHTDGKSVTNQRGWVCVGFLFCEPENVVFSGWSEHGMCELYTPINNTVSEAEFMASGGWE